MEMMSRLFDETSGKFEAELLSRTVEGVEGPASYGFASGIASFCPQPIAQKAGPNLKLLAEFLRSNRPISKEIRDWLANMADAEGSGTSHLSITRRKDGRPKKSMFEHHEAVSEFILHFDMYGFESAYTYVTKKFSISRSTLFKARKELETFLRSLPEHT